jgi:hypothetical protein
MLYKHENPTSSKILLVLLLLLPIVAFKNFRTKVFFWENFFPKTTKTKKTNNFPKGFLEIKMLFFPK